MLKTERKRILIDVTFLFDQYSDRGIGRYGKDLLVDLIPLILEEKDEWAVHLIGFKDKKENLIKLGFSNFAVEEIIDDIQFSEIKELTLSTTKNYKQWNEDYRPVLEELEPDIFFPIHFERGLPRTKGLDLSFDLKTVVPAHDAIPFIFGRYSSKSIFHNLLKRRFYKRMWTGVQNADLVLAPSDLSKNDLVEYGKVDEEKIRRIYLGIDKTFRKENMNFEKDDLSATLERLSVKGKNYFFYDSGLEENKGVKELVELFALLVNSDDSSSSELGWLVVTGGGALKRGVGENIEAKDDLGKKFLRLAKKKKVLWRIISTGTLEDDELKMVLSKAKAYMYMTQYEGFGFGIVQAMAARVPAIGADRSCIPEVTDGGALLVDTDDLESAKKQIQKFLNNSEFRKEIQKKAKKVVDRYNWEQTAEESWEEVKQLTIDSE